MQQSPIIHSLDRAAIAGAGIPLSSERHFSAGADDRSLDQAISPFSAQSDTFPGHLPPPPLGAVNLSLQRRRRSSKPTMAAIVKRSASTPNVRGLAVADGAALSYAADKRRNKLGYHRTSVACGHCRRRKIRCLLAQDDPQGRCSNCIRLKKECNFFPVDQQPPSDRPQVGSKTERNSADKSSSSSPSSSHPQAGIPHEHMANGNHYHPGPTTAAYPDYRRSDPAIQRDGSVSSMNRAPILPSSTGGGRPPLQHTQTAPLLPGAFDFGRSERPSTWEGSPYLDQSPLSGGSKPSLDDPSTNFWRLHESPMTPAYSSFAGPPGPPSVQHRESVSAYPYGVQREGLAWPVPSRSMSYGQLEGLSVNQPNQYPVMVDYKHSAAGSVYTPSYSSPPYSTPHTSITSLAEPVSAPANGRIPNGSFGMHPPWNPSFTGSGVGGNVPGKTAEGFGGWYQEPNRLSQVEEEVSTGPLNEEGPSYYPGTAQSTG